MPGFFVLRGNIFSRSQRMQPAKRVPGVRGRRQRDESLYYLAVALHLHTPCLRIFLRRIRIVRSHLFTFLFALMKIHLKNVGTIKKLDFELRRGLTLFCGPNSTGKTYAAYAVYSVLQNLQRFRQDWLDATQLQELWTKGRLSIDLIGDL